MEAPTPVRAPLCVCGALCSSLLSHQAPRLHGPAPGSRDLSLSTEHAGTSRRVGVPVRAGPVQGPHPLIPSQYPVCHVGARGDVSDPQRSLT